MYSKAGRFALGIHSSSEKVTKYVQIFFPRREIQSLITEGERSTILKKKYRANRPSEKRVSFQKIKRREGKKEKENCKSGKLTKNQTVEKEKEKRRGSKRRERKREIINVDFFILLFQKRETETWGDDHSISYVA